MAVKDPSVIEYGAVREAIGKLLTVGQFSDDDDLIGLGLDSLKIMRFVGRLRKAGVKVTFAEMIAKPTLKSWMDLFAAKTGIAGGAAEGFSSSAGHENEPFALTDVQYAYWIGRRDGQPLGGIGCHAYIELDGHDVDPKRLGMAWRTVLNHHAMLRAVFHENGTQQILGEAASDDLIVHDLSGLSAQDIEARLAALREKLSHRRFEVEKGRLAGLELCLLPENKTRLFFDIDLLVADVQSFCIILRDLAAVYARGAALPAPAEWSFSRYLARKNEESREDRERDKAWWKERLADLPGAPSLPMKCNPEEITRATYRRRIFQLSPQAWRSLKQQAQSRNVTPAMLLLTAYAEVLGRWSSVPRFFINLPLFDREAGEAGIDEVVADFTNLLLVDVDCSERKTFFERLKDIQARFYGNVAHSSYTGVQIQRDLAKLRPNERFIAPVVFACNLGHSLLSQECRETLGRLNDMLSQTPQVWLDFQMYEMEEGGLALCWDTAEELFIEGTVDDMLSAYGGLLECLAGDDTCWDQVPDVLPAEQKRRREADKALACQAPDDTLHSAFFAYAAEHPDAAAIYDGSGNRTISYGELAGQALRTAAMLRSHGLKKCDPVAVTLPKGPDQIIAVLGVLAAGGFYVPVSHTQPLQRRTRIHRKINIRYVLSRADVIADKDLPEGSELVDLARRVDFAPLERPVEVSSADLAYAIFTSGSTGEPKGVAIEHRSARNTIAGLNEKFRIGEGDACLAVSALDFDLSVYDIFGMLASGASIVTIDESMRRSAEDWRRLLEKYHVTVWNSVPILLDMLLVDVESKQAALPLRLVMLSGDWIGLDLPQRLKNAAPDAKMIAMGGATEASIWSNIQEVEVPIPSFWKSIPYGRPLPRQSYRVVDALGRDCPDWVDGELWIGGAGVARCYLGDPELTAARYSEEQGIRWYRTGDLGRFWPDGTIEFLGRADSQVKIRGHRIELGEIEAALKEHSQVKDAVVMAVSGARGIRRLGAYIVPQSAVADEKAYFQETERFLRERVPEYMVPAAFMLLDALPLSANGKLNRKALPAFQEAQEENCMPSTGMEKSLAAVWERVLQLPSVGIHDNFFELGGDSLVATHLVAEIQKELGCSLTLDCLFRCPDIAHLAADLEAQGNAKPEHAERPALPQAENLPAQRYEPFPLTDVQHAYWIGRIGAYELGSVSSHVYFEFDNTGFDLRKLNEAWNKLVRRHEMLRAVFLADGTQRILQDTGDYAFRTYDLRRDAESGSAMEKVRREMSEQLLPADTWPLFDIRAALYDADGCEHIRLFLDFDAMIADAWSIFLLVEEWLKLYRNPSAELPPLSLSFRDYVLAEQKICETPQWRADFEYWQKRLSDLPPAPELPLAKQPSEIKKAHTVRLADALSPDLWASLKEKIRQNGLSSSGVLMAAYAETLARWSSSSRFTLNLTLFNRLPLHGQVNDIVGDFSSLDLLVVDSLAGKNFRERAQRIQEQLWEDMSHRLVSGVRVLRELAAQGRQIRMPIVFTGAVSLGSAGRDASSFSGMGTLVTSITQTPQVWLDHQTYEQDGQLLLNWDAVEGLFPDGMLEDMFETYVRLLHRLASDDSAWNAPSPLELPERQKQERLAYNNTEWTQTNETLASLFLKTLEQNAPRTAVITRSGSISYAELSGVAFAVAHALAEKGVGRGDLVGVVMEKGWEQAAAVVGTVLAGAAYVPVDCHVPYARLEQIAEGAGIRVILTQTPWINGLRWPEGTDVIDVDSLAPRAERPNAALPDPADLAYIIYTSGSTGKPKGVAIEHRGAVNTILDINDRFSVGPEDRTFGLSALNFDLSVYDIWGAFLAGGAVVIPDAAGLKDPSHWLGLAADSRVTVWNSVPMLMQMLVEYMEFSSVTDRIPLRLVMMSGDWIPLDLPRRIQAVAPHAELYSLGGATEASIWSIIYPIKEVLPEWKSIPYGMPLRNQRFYVANERLEDCPDYVAGELLIGGLGLAREYWKDEIRTAESFIAPAFSDQRFYKTGDLGRMMPGGYIEFLGRKDFQVKIRGHRIELGEIESVLLSRQDVRECVVIVTGENAALRKLVAFVVPEGAFDESAALMTVKDRLPDYMVPSAIIALDAMPLSANGKVDRKQLIGKVSAAAFQEKKAVLASTEAEKLVAQAWEAVLGREILSIEDNFFDVGGTSVLAVRLHRELAARFNREFPLVSVFEHPSVKAMAEFLGTEEKTQKKESDSVSRRVEMRRKRRGL